MGVSIYTPDSTKILHTAYADFVSRQISRKVHVVQYDDGLPILAVKLFSDGQPYTIPSNADINIKLRKPDGKFVYNPALGCDSTRRIVYFEITYQMVVLSGEVSPIVEVVIGTSVSASSSIGIIIDRNPISSSMISSTSEWKTIKSSIEYAKESLDAAAKASASRSAAAISESNALSYRNAAQTAATNASNSASSAATSETNAAKYSKAAESYAIGDTDYRENESVDNAKYYYQLSKEISERLGGALLLSGVKGDAETEYRTGYVNITPENIGAYDKDSIDQMMDTLMATLGKTINSLTAKIEELEELSAYSYLVDSEGNKFVTSDGYKIILAN